MDNKGSVVPNLQNIVADVVEGEAVIINIATGIYYSIDGIGGWIWDQISAGASIAAIRSALCAAPGADETEVDAALDSFLAELMTEDLVRPSADAADISVAPPKIAFAVPVLNVYRDMTDLMALDPPMPMLDAPTR
ncbi:PqqD family protein [Flavisphingomonas formosensis]|uniref:PqqD family protein n=1 Tax=Flavisphingomonas formosensis TaxID=861534 RepID=UPI0012F7C689|nr:PqqD family protein [Sphingomonas formosensis]